MKKIIKISENDLIELIKETIKSTKLNSTKINEQSRQDFKDVYDLRNTDIPYTCVQKIFIPFVNYIIKNKNKLSEELGVDEKTLITLTKLSLGIIGRETKWGEYSEFQDQASEALRTFGLGFLVDTGVDIVNKLNKTKKTQSLGYGQFTPETWKRYGLDKKIGDYNQSFNATNQAMGVLHMLSSNYKKALSSGLKNEPSQNPILSKYLGIKIDGTGNNALDLAIISHNMSTSKTLVKYCTTNNPLYAAPCSNTSYSPFKDENSFKLFLSKSELFSKVSDNNLKKFPGVLKVNTSDVIPNYFPNLKGPTHTAIGYLEEVVKNSKIYNCF